MRICYIGWGDSIHMQRFVKWFAEQGHEVHLITNMKANMKEIIEHDIEFPLNTNEGFKKYLPQRLSHYLGRLQSIASVWKLVRRIDPDILHLQTLYYPARLGSYIYFHPLVISPWNGDILWVPDDSKFRRRLVGHSLRTADVVTVDCNVMKDVCIKYRIQPSRITILQWGVDLKRFKPDVSGAEIRTVLGLGDCPVIISTRGLGPEYNIDVIVESIPLVLEQFPNAKFLFLWPSGTGKQYESLIKLSESLGVADSAIFFQEKIEYEKMPLYFNVSDVLVSISSCDSTPYSLMEAMASGIAPVVGDLLAIKEWIKDGFNGYLVPLRDVEKTAEAIIKLLKDEDNRKLFTARNLKIVREKADHDKEMRRMEDLYYSLVEEARG